jgi:hypothetical protein
MKSLYKFIGIITLLLVIGIILTSCNNSRKQFEGTWTGYVDHDYTELAIVGTTWRGRGWGIDGESGNCRYSGNTVTFIDSDGKPFWVGTVAGNGMVLKTGRNEYSFTRK